MTTSATCLGKKLEDMGQLDNTIVVFTTDNGAETITFPDGGVTPFKGPERRRPGRAATRAANGHPLAGPHQAGHGEEPSSSPSLDWVPTFVDIAGGPKGDGLKQQIEAGQYPNIVKTTLGRRRSARLSRRKDRKRRRVTPFFSTIPGSHAVGGTLQELVDVRPYRNPPAGWIMPLVPFHFTWSPTWAIRSSRKGDRPEYYEGEHRRALAGPVTAFIYDWNMLPIGQQLWLKHLETFE